MKPLQDSPASTPGAAHSEEIPPRFRLSTYSFHLPAELIAQEPSPERDKSRLMLLDRERGSISHRVFSELPFLLDPSDLLVLNETKVVPAALTGHKASGGKVDLLVLNPACPRAEAHEPAVRSCMFRSGKPLRPGTTIFVEGGIELTAVDTTEPGRIDVEFPSSEENFLDFLGEYGSTPLPPYIRNQSRRGDRDRERYQTVYSRTSGSVAAPTAGLHFTRGLLAALEERGVLTTKILLHVGPGTFRPVKTEDIRSHRMESEFFEISPEAAAAVNDAREQGRRIIAVGTTAVRTLESAAAEDGTVSASSGQTSLFIVPGYEFRIVQGLVTNFHLPGSTLLMLVCALGGREMVLAGYTEAVKGRYRFYSYGDACLIV